MYPGPGEKPSSFAVADSIAQLTLDDEAVGSDQDEEGVAKTQELPPHACRYGSNCYMYEYFVAKHDCILASFGV